MNRWRRRPEPDVVTPPDAPRGVIQVCHPDWRGVRESAHAFGDPVVEAADLSTLVPSLAAWQSAGVERVVIQGWPPNADAFARAASATGLRVCTVFHSSPAQHGVDAGEAEAVTTMLDLQRSGVVERVGTVKAGIASSMARLGVEVAHLDNRVPVVAPRPIGAAGEGVAVGIFLFPMWRKNVTTQVLAAVEMRATPHVMADPGVGYLRSVDMVVHGELDRESFLDVLATMDVSLNVTLSECHPMLPMESYRLGVPCLLSPTSGLFADHDELQSLTVVNRSDDPSAIADAATRLLANRDRAVSLARDALDELDAVAAARWEEFTR